VSVARRAADIALLLRRLERGKEKSMLDASVGD
jgi:hypothetical protein